MSNVFGSSINDTLYGTASDDFLYGGAGDDLLDGRAGNDLLLADEGADLVYGGAGNDTIDGGGGNDFLTGDSSTVFTGDDHDLLLGGAGDDIMISGRGRDTLVGADGNDFLIVDPIQTEAVELDGGAGNDTLFAFALGGAIDAGADADTLYLLSTDEVSTTITLGGGADTLNIFNAMGTGPSALTSGAFRFEVTDFTLGEDTIQLFDTFDSAAMDLADAALGARLFGLSGEGADAVLTTTTGGRVVLQGVSVEAMLTQGGLSFANVTLGTEAANKMAGTVGDDVVNGLGGNDRIALGTGNDIACGGAGNDSLYGNAGQDTLIGGAGDDMLQANSGNDLLLGGDGNDTIYAGIDSATVDGGAGADVIELRGQLGADHRVTGGAGADVFAFLSLNETAQADAVLTDFEIGIDRVTIEGHDLAAYCAARPGVAWLDTEDGALMTLTEGDTILFAGLTAAAIVANFDVMT